MNTFQTVYKGVVLHKNSVAYQLYQERNKSDADMKKFKKHFDEVMSKAKELEK